MFDSQFSLFIQAFHLEFFILNSNYFFFKLKFSGVEIGDEISFNGNGYVELSGDLLPHVQLDDSDIVELQFSTSHNEGILLWHGRDPKEFGRNQDYFAIASMYWSNIFKQFASITKSTSHSQNVVQIFSKERKEKAHRFCLPQRDL